MVRSNSNYSSQKESNKGDRSIIYRVIRREAKSAYKNPLEIILYETSSKSTATAMVAYTANLIRWRIVRPSKITLYKCEVLKELPTVTYSTEKIGEVGTDGLTTYYK